jgi:hypothetical protein
VVLFDISLAQVVLFVKISEKTTNIALEQLTVEVS